MGRAVWSREVGWFVAIGVASTAGQALLYWGLRPWSPPAVANLVSLLVLTVLNTEANRRLTFRHAATTPARAHLGAGGLFLLGYLVTSGAVLWFTHLRPDASPPPRPRSSPPRPSPSPSYASSSCGWPSSAPRVRTRPRCRSGRTRPPGVVGRAAELLGHPQVPQSLKSAFFHVSGHSLTVPG